MSCPRCLAWLKLLVAGPVKALLGRSTHALVNWTVTVIIAVIDPLGEHTNHRGARWPDLAGQPA
jgi:hypothetical protein